MAEKELRAEWFWTDRWMTSSAFLLPAEPRGVYREMLTQAWMRGGSLPDDHEAIQRACGLTRSEWKRCWPKVQRYWRVEGETLVNDTQLEVMAVARDGADRAAEKARVAANKRWENERARASAQEDAQAHAQASARAPLEECPPSPSPSPRTTNPPDPPASAGGHPVNGNGHHPPADILRRERLEAKRRIEDQVEQARQFALGGGYRLPHNWRRTFRGWFERGASLAHVQEGIEKGDHLPARRL